MSTQQNIHTAPLVRLAGAGVSRAGARLLSGIDFSLEAGARWAVLGANGAGKTTFLRLLRGDIQPDIGTNASASASKDDTRVYNLPGQGGPQRTPLGLRQRLALVSGDMQDLYARNDWAITGLEAVLTGFYDTTLLYAAPTPEQRRQAQATLAQLGLEHLANKSVGRMSTGQARSLLLARALACAPDALILDECLEGLDAPARAAFLATLDRAVEVNPQLAMLFSSHRVAEPDRPGEIPACVNLALVLESGRIIARGSLSEVLAELKPRHTPVPPDLDAGTKAGPCAGLLPAPARATPAQGAVLVRISGADVVLDGRELLTGIHWTIRPGEHWAVLGANGAGKTTLLNLLAGDIWPSALTGAPGRVEYGFAPDGETLDDTRRRIGRVGAALDRDYGWDLPVDEVVWSGAFGSIGLYAETGPDVRERARQWMDFFGLTRLTKRSIRSLSRGQLRRVMLARAMLGHAGCGPALLLLDEPMAGLDAHARKDARELFSRLAETGTPLVMVTHHLRDLPEQMNRVLLLEAGRIVFCGERGEFEARQAVRTGRTA